jgi:glycosyltransferase involved in cell wall biosynthesis
MTDSMLRVCHVSKADSLGGGASKVAEDLVDLLLKAGHHADHYCSWSGKPYGPHRHSLYGKFAREIRFLQRQIKYVGFPELIPFELLTLLRPGRISRYDIIHFHDLSSAISPLTLVALAKFKPVVWTLHDCSGFTGGCLYPLGCENYRTGCGNCPQIGEWPLDTHVDFTRFHRWIKSVVHRSGVVTVTPSNWMADLAMESGLLRQRPLVVNNGIDVHVYRYNDKGETRKALGLPLDRRIILVSAGDLSDPRKGTRFAVAALRGISEFKPFVLLLGKADQTFLESLNGLDIHVAGYVSDPSELNKYYSAADIFLFCSLADNQPLAVIESMASGTPVVGFATGGVPEMLQNNVSGLLVVQGDHGALVSAIHCAFTDDHYRRWALNARRHVEQQFSHEALLQRHLDLYNSLIAQHRAGQEG